MFRNIGLSWTIETKDHYKFTVKSHFIEWCTGGPWLKKNCQNLHGPIFEEFFVTARQDICDLMCALHAYDKNNYNLTDETNFGDERPLPEDSTINHIISLCVSINVIYTWLVALANKFTCRCCAYQEKTKELSENSY